MKIPALFLSLSLSLMLSMPPLASAQCFGPGGCQPNPPPIEPTGPAELCLPDGCMPIGYQWSGDYAVAHSQLPNGYPVMGMAGPCFSVNRADCPDIFNQAAAMLKPRALEANRAQRY